MVAIGSMRRFGASVGIQIIDRPWCLSSPLVVRQTTRMCRAIFAFEQNTFWPRITKPPSTRSAEVAREPTSEPASGSVIAIASTSPPAMPPSRSRF
jgi:hypothetical protein